MSQFRVLYTKCWQIFAMVKSCMWLFEWSRGRILSSGTPWHTRTPASAPTSSSMRCTDTTCVWILLNLEQGYVVLLFFKNSKFPYFKLIPFFTLAFRFFLFPSLFFTFLLYFSFSSLFWSLASLFQLNLFQMN